MLTKQGVLIKALTDAGDGIAQIAQMGVIDKDHDVTEPGFFGEQTVVMLPTHDWSHVPIGKGRLYEEGESALVAFSLNLKIPSARDWHEQLLFDMANPPPLQEYSYGFDVLEGGSRKGDFQGQPVRYLQPRPDGTPGAKVYEFSTVLVGAGESTGTRAVKSARMAEQIEAVLESNAALLSRVESLAEVRAADGKAIGEETTHKLTDLADRLDGMATSLRGAVVTPSTGIEEAASALAAFVRLEQQLTNIS